MLATWLSNGDAAALLNKKGEVEGTSHVPRTRSLKFIELIRTQRAEAELIAHENASVADSVENGDAVRRRERTRPRPSQILSSEDT